MSLTVHSVSDRDQWIVSLAEVGEHDFVHTYDFHRLSQSNGEGVPLMFVVRSDNGKACACWPLLSRSIPGTDYHDLTSVYGYAGPIFSDSSSSDRCVDLMILRMREEGYVSLFSRMHPLFINDLLNETSKGLRLGDVVILPIAPTDNVLLTYRGSHRREILSSRRNGVEIVVSADASDLPKFIDIYQSAMAELGASDYYYFNESYFEQLCASSDFKVLIVSAIYEGVYIASSLFIVVGKVMQYYLSGTVSEYRKYSPSKAIIAKAHEIAISMGCDNLVLGGGVGSKIDPLFKFKQGFSDYSLPFYVKKEVLNHDLYVELVLAAGNEKSDSGYFPLYRLA